MTSPSSSSPSNMFWLVYVLAWLPYLTGLIAVFEAEPAPLWQSTVQALNITLPLFIAGIVLVHFLRKALWNPQAMKPFFIKQCLLATLFMMLTLPVIALSGNLLEWFYTGTFQLQIFNSFTPLVVFNNFLIFCSLSAIVNGAALSKRLGQEAARRAAAELLQGKAELQVLRAQLNPHFLFNTLHSLQALIRIAPERAEDALDQFGALMRYPLRVQQQRLEFVALEEEWQFILNYLELEILRFGDRLRVETHVDEEALACAFPPLLLQPLVENAVRYAVEPRSHGATLVLEARRQGENLSILVQDDGPGCSKNRLNDTGVGLGAAQKRFQALYDTRGFFRVETAPGKGFRVEMQLPTKPYH